MARKSTKPPEERRRYPIGYNWKKERRKARLEERLNAEKARADDEGRDASGPED